MQAAPILEAEVQYLRENQESLAQQYPNQFLVIQGQAVIHADLDEGSAIDTGMEKLHGDFLVRHVNYPEDPLMTTGLVAVLPPLHADPNEATDIAAQADTPIPL